MNNVENRLKEIGKYDELRRKYRGNILGIQMRRIAGTNSLSEHALGLAIDIAPNKNPQILGRNRIMTFFIRKATGFDIDRSKTVDDVKNAHYKFLSLYANVDNQILENKYVQIQRYRNNTEAIQLSDLQNVDSQLQLLQERYNLALNDDTEYVKIAEIKNEIYSLVTKINNLSAALDYYINAVIFSDASKNALANLKSRIQSIDQHFNQLKTGNENKVNFIHLYYSDVGNVVLKEIDNFISEAMSIKRDYQNLEIFGRELIDAIKRIGFNNVLLRDGFSDVEREIIDAFLNSESRLSNSRIRWGGTYNRQIDAMHFELIIE